MFTKLTKSLLRCHYPQHFSTARVLSSEYYSKILDDVKDLTTVKTEKIEHRDKKGKVISVIDLYGIPANLLEETKNNLIPEQLQNVFAKKDEVVFIQIDPTNYLHLRRKLASALNESKFKSKDVEELVNKDPVYPMAWEELIVDNAIFRAFKSTKKDNKKTSTQNSDEERVGEEAHDQGKNDQIKAPVPQIPEDIKVKINRIEHSLDMDINLATPEGFKMFYDTLEETIIPEKDLSFYYELNNLLLYEVLLQNEVVLGGIPRIMNRLIVGNSLTLTNAQELFKSICSTLREIKENISLSELAKLMFPDVFAGPEDLYMTLLLRELANEHKTLRAYVKCESIEPIKDLWNNELLQGSTFASILGIPDRNPKDTVDSLIEKHAMFDAMLGEKIWSLRYIKDVFPYLDPNEKKDENLKEIQKKFYVHHKRYSELKEAFTKQKGSIGNLSPAKS